MTLVQTPCDGSLPVHIKGREFVLDEWRHRADRRRASLVRRGYSELYAFQKLSYDLQVIRSLNTLIEWCQKRGLTVLFGKHENGTYDECYRTIVIAANALPEKQVFYLLHECGHHLVFSHPGNPNRFEMGYPQTDKSVTRTFQHRLACLEEEMEAWQRGRSLAKKLKLKFNEVNLEKLRIHCLTTYVKWACKKK